MNSTDFNIIPKSDELDFRSIGNLILNRSISLSIAVNNELLSPISQWLDDPGFMEKFAIILDQDAPNWAKYKKKQRQWTAQKKALASERLRLYWREIRKKRQMRQELSKLIPRAGSGTHPKTTLASGAIAEIVKPFSPPECSKRDTERQFREAQTRQPSDILPWKTILQSDIQELQESHESGSFDQFKQYHNDIRLDTVSKMIHLLDLETAGQLKLNQPEPFGKIQIRSGERYPTSGPEGSFSTISIKDRQGKNFEFRWPELTGGQRNKIVEDLLKNEICVV